MCVCIMYNIITKLLYENIDMRFCFHYLCVFFILKQTAKWEIYSCKWNSQSSKKSNDGQIEFIENNHKGRIAWTYTFPLAVISCYQYVNNNVRSHSEGYWIFFGYKQTPSIECDDCLTDLDDKNHQIQNRNIWSISLRYLLQSIDIQIANFRIETLSIYTL